MYVCNEFEATDVVSLTETDKKHYRALFSSVLVSYDNLKIGGEIGQGTYDIVCIAGNVLTDPILTIFMDNYTAHKK